MPTYLDDESSVQDGEPREGYEFVLPAVTYRLTGGDRDLIIDGNRYRKDKVSRGEIRVSSTTGAQELEVALPLAHPIAQRWAQGGVPPRSIGVTIRRKMLRSGESETIWVGSITSMAADLNAEGHVAKFLVPSRFGQVLVRRLPTVTVGRNCPHILYDANCKAPRNSFRVATIANVVDGNVITVASVGGNPDHLFENGELFHPASGERMTIFDQVGTTIILQLPIFELQSGQNVEIFAGCRHDLNDCRNVFNNVPHYGGGPNTPIGNPFFNQKLGIYGANSVS